MVIFSILLVYAKILSICWVSFILKPFYPSYWFSAIMSIILYKHWWKIISLPFIILQGSFILVKKSFEISFKCCLQSCVFLFFSFISSSQFFSRIIKTKVWLIFWCFPWYPFLSLFPSTLKSRTENQIY